MDGCGYDGVAELAVDVVGGERVLRWVSVPERVHVHESVITDNRLLDKYDIGEWCPRVQAFHGTRREQADQ